MYDWNWSSSIEFRNCGENTSIEKGIRKLFKIIDHVCRVLKNVGKVFVTQNNVAIDAQTSCREEKTG